MNKVLRSLLLLCFLASSLFAQKKLTQSAVAGHYTYIYRLTDKQTHLIAAKSSSVINDSFMHTLVDSFYNDIKKPYKGALPYAIQNKNLRVNLLQQYGSTEAKTLGTISPYHEGGYEYSFVLADSLDLTLDQQYVIAMFENKGKEGKE